MTEDYFSGVDHESGHACARSHDEVEMVRQPDHEHEGLVGGIDVYRCPECGHETAEKEYPDGSTWSPPIFTDHPTVTVEETDDDRRPYRVHTGPPGDPPIRCRTRTQAEDLAAVATVTGFREEDTGSRGIPPSVAQAGVPEVVTYVLAHPDSGVPSAETLGRAWDIDRETIRSHLSDVRTRAGNRR